MDPVALAATTAAVITLATECLKGTAGKVGEDLWTRVKSAFGWKADPSVQDLPVAVAEALQEDAKLATAVVKMLQKSKVGTIAALVGRIDAKNVIIISRQRIEKNFTIKMGD